MSVDDADLARLAVRLMTAMENEDREMTLVFRDELEELRAAIGNGNNQYKRDNPTKEAREKRQAVINRDSSHYTPMNPDGADTQLKFSDGKGGYTPERKELHDAIVAEVFAGKTPVEAPVAVVLGGGPASGKSSVLSSSAEDNVVLIDVDKIRTYLPEQREGVAAKDAAVSGRTHEESSEIANRVMKEAAAGGYNLMLDGTGDSSIEKLEKKVNAMKAGGAKVTAKYASLPTDMAVDLMMKRGAKTGRYVPESFLRATHAAVSRVFPEAMAKGLFDDAQLFDTTINGKPQLVASAKGKDVTIHDDTLWNTFLAKGR
jgi:predicted ABC-type ATPase